MLRLRRSRVEPPPPEIFWVEDLRPIRLAIMPRPRGGDELEADVKYLAEQEVDTLVSLLQEEEMARVGLAEEAGVCRAHGIGFRHFPIPDHDVPASSDRFIRFVDSLVPTVDAHRALAIHCFAGIGRSSLTAAAVLLRAGVPPARIFPALSRARGMRVPETTEQALWFKQLVADHRP